MSTNQNKAAIYISDSTDTFIQKQIIYFYV
jgi:hypothetical protein